MKTIIKILIAVLVLSFLVHTSSLKPGLLLDLFDSPLLLLLTLLIYFIVIGISTWRWMLLNKTQGIALSYQQTILPTYLGIAFNNLLPGGVGGDFFRFYFLNKACPARKSTVMLSILLDRITGLMGIFIAVFLVSILNYNAFSQHKFILYFVYFCLLPCVGIAGIYLASLLLPAQVGVSAWLSARFPAENKWSRLFLSLLDTIRIYRNAKKTLVQCLLASFIIQVFIAVTCMLIARMIHLPAIPLAHYMLAIAVTQLVNLIPITPGGIGVGEMAFANVLMLLNPQVSVSLATVFLAYRVVGIVCYLPGVLVFLFERKLAEQV
jgi:uncharacterized protein (TIRG00374 family)